MREIEFRGKRKNNGEWVYGDFCTMLDRPLKEPRDKMSRESFIFYQSFHKALEPLPPESYKNVMTSILEYALIGKEPELEGIEQSFFILIKPQIDANQARYENGKNGGRPKKTEQEPNHNQDITEPKPKDNQTITEQEPNVNDNVNDNVNENNVGAFAPSDGSGEPPLSESQESALELSELLLSSHRKEIPDYLSGKDKSVIPRWAKDVEKLIRIDKKSPETIRQVILWAKTPGNFWFPHIESGKKLREKFERLYGQMLQKPSTGPPRRLKADEVPPEAMAKLFKEAGT